MKSPKMISDNRHWQDGGWCHREGGPSCEYPDGSKQWHVHGNLHREDGPAVENADGTEQWYRNGKPITPAKRGAP